MKDRWVHRSSGMLCRTCMYYVEKPNAGHTDEEKRYIRYSPLGRCRRRAPTMSGYPVVFPEDWCGDHKLDEEKMTVQEPKPAPKGQTRVGTIEVSDKL